MNKKENDFCIYAITVIFVITKIGLTHKFYHMDSKINFPNPLPAPDREQATAISEVIRLATLQGPLNEKATAGIHYLQTMIQKALEAQGTTQAAG